MTTTEINKVKKYLKERSNNNQKSAGILEALEKNIPIGQQEYIIQKNINPAILKKVLYGEKNEKK